MISYIKRAVAILFAAALFSNIRFSRKRGGSDLNRLDFDKICVSRFSVGNTAGYDNTVARIQFKVFFAAESA